MVINSIHKFVIFISLIIGTIVTSCSTGVESTKTIALSRQEKRILSPTPEEQLMSRLEAPSLAEWMEGRRFLVTDNRAAYIFTSPGAAGYDVPDLDGHILKYKSHYLRKDPGGMEKMIVTFSDSLIHREYFTGRGSSESQSFTSLDVPLTIDLDLVDEAAKILTGLKVWTRSTLWYDKDSNKIEGRQFVPVTIREVLPGDKDFPLHLRITDSNEDSGFIYMNFNNSGNESRNFKNLFYLSDPKLKYPSISPEIWDFICRRKVKEGMTKEECKLALGNPSDVNSGHDWNSTIDLWKFDNGTFLQFRDGLLESWRY